MWDTILCKAEFAHNQAVNRSTGFCSFRIVYGIIPRGPLDLGVAPDLSRYNAQAVDFVGSLAHIHGTVHDNLQVSSDK